MKRTIDYTSYDFEALRDELITYLQETGSFKDVQFISSNIRTLVDLFSYIGSLFGYYINSAANEVFLPTAKRYKNLNKIAQLLRYEPRGVTSSRVNVVAQLSPEYVFSKESVGLEIPAYSIFPSSKPTNDTNENFQFTNDKPVNYIIKGVGTRPVQASDIEYKGYSLPYTAPLSFWNNNSGVYFQSNGIDIPLSMQKQLRVIENNDITNYRGFDTTNYPLINPSSNQSVGQPFQKTIKTNDFGSLLVPNTRYFLVMNFDDASSDSYMTIIQNESTLGDKIDDVVAVLILEATDKTGEFYTLKVDEIRTFHRFYVGTLGLTNLESVFLEYDRLPNRTDGLEKIKMVINKDGNSPDFAVLVDGVTYAFNSGTIETPKYKEDNWDRDRVEYNLNLVISNPDSPETNYDAKLEITSNEPLSNQVTIAKIYTNFVDPDTGTPTIKTQRGRKFGDFQIVDKIETKGDIQKAGTVDFNSGENFSAVIFSTPFENDNYQVSLSSQEPIRSWVANKNVEGFTIYVEPGNNFEGKISWIATSVIEENINEVNVTFSTPMSLSVSPDGNISNYMVQLTANDNVNMWYDNLNENGFTIKTEKNFRGHVSWSAFNFFADGTVPQENVNSLRQRGNIVFRSDDLINGIDIEFEVPINDENYAIQLTPDKDVNVWYTKKSSNGFTINIEPSSEEPVREVVIEWIVDITSEYTFQKHGEIKFRGQDTLNSQIPGLQFVNISESFQIPDLIEGQPSISFISSNAVVDSDKNGLQLSLDPVRFYETDIRFVVNNKNISTNGIRVFVKNEEGKWDEWDRASLVTNKNTAAGEKIYIIRVNPEEKVLIEFGDGDNWGTSVLDKEVLILGLISVGESGNINRRTLDKRVILSQYILGNDITNIDFEQNFINLIGLKNELYFEGRVPETSILDSERTLIPQNKLLIVQNQNAFGGNDIETANELRKNANNFFVSQNRLVSLDDYERFSRQAFSDYLIKTKVLSYTEVKQQNLLSDEELEQYWFNHVFLVGLNADGSNIIPKNLREFISGQLDDNKFRLIGADHEVISATWVPIDVAIKYKKTDFGSAQAIENQLRNILIDFFKSDNHELGAKIYHSKLINLLSVDNVESIEVFLNRDENNTLKASDYDVDFRTDEPDQNVAIRNRLMELMAKDKSLAKIYQPLFDTLKSDGTREWNFSLDIQLSDFEFPQLGDVTIERE